MKKKSFHKYLLCLLTGMLIVGSISVYAVSTIIDSKEVSYDKKNSNGSYDNVQDSIDELYKRYKDLSGEQDTIYTEKILNGADPVLGDGMIPITLDSKGNVKYANLYTPWYSYEEKKWANAVILVGNPSKKYKIGDTIFEKDIESYFVWIPKYSYRIWDMSNYTTTYNLSQLIDSKDDAGTDYRAIRHLSNNARVIDIKFGKDENETTQAVGSYYTHPAFTDFGVNGLWVGKFETGYNQATVDYPILDTSEWKNTGAAHNTIASDYIIIKPNVCSWNNQSVGNVFKTAYNYNRTLDSHMIKNIEWGAVAYLSHSAYGKGSGVNVNNSSSFFTGSSASLRSNQNTMYGDTNDYEKWNSPTGYLASTTGNITGIYDMSGGVDEYVAGYVDGYGIKTKNGVASEFVESDLTIYSKYFDKYSSNCTSASFNCRRLGDATGEMGPFYVYYEKDNGYVHNSWYGNYSYFIYGEYPWFVRGGAYNGGLATGIFYFYTDNGSNLGWVGSRLVLAVK